LVFLNEFLSTGEGDLVNVFFTSSAVIPIPLSVIDRVFLSLSMEIWILPRYRLYVSSTGYHFELLNGINSVGYEFPQEYFVV